MCALHALAPISPASRWIVNTLVRVIINGDLKISPNNHAFTICKLNSNMHIMTCYSQAGLPPHPTPLSGTARSALLEVTPGNDNFYSRKISNIFLKIAPQVVFYPAYTT